MDDNYEFVVRDELREKREKIQNIDELILFLKDVKENYNSGYGVEPRAIAQAALATAFYLSGEFIITGFQAGCTMWDFIRDWEFRNNKCGMKIIDYDEMLYPQYEYKFANQIISKSVWEALQEEAKNELNDAGRACGSVIKHWQSIVDGNVPFGCKVEE